MTDRVAVREWLSGLQARLVDEIESADGESSLPGPEPSSPIVRTGCPVAREKTTMRARRLSST